MILAHEPYFIVGAGARPTFICNAQGVFSTAANAFVVQLHAATVTVDAPAYTVTLDGGASGVVRVTENEDGVWLNQDGECRCLARGMCRLPAFDGHPHRDRLRVLHHEILTNIVGHAPIPNIFVYDCPWYRDAAMVCMVLEKTGNLDCVRDWIVSLQSPYDRNNAGHEEPDNLGQVLAMLSLVADSSHPLVPVVLAEAKRRSRHGHLTGMSDFAEHPVYQTEWLNYGLERLGLTDSYVVPKVPDSYASLLWWRRNSIPVDCVLRSHAEAWRYPYLTWAESHFFRDPMPWDLSADSYPITWEADASQAAYDGMVRLSPGLAERKTCMPHTWHAAEMFLYLYEQSAMETPSPLRNAAAAHGLESGDWMGTAPVPPASARC